jgi:hypothetical protein
MPKESVENSIYWIETIIKRNQLSNVCTGNAVVIHLDCTKSCEQEYFRHTTNCNNDARYDAVMLSIYKVKALGKKSSHRNAVLVDHSLRTYERFEPHGSNSSHDNVVDHFMEKDFRVAFKLDKYTYIPPSNFCPRFGPQKYVSGTHFSGTCIFWSLWYLEQRLLNPEKEQSQILKELINHFEKNGPDYAVSFIKSYVDKLNRQDVYIHHDYSTATKKFSSPTFSSEKKKRYTHKRTQKSTKSHTTKTRSEPKRTTKKRSVPKRRSSTTKKRSAPKRRSSTTKKRSNKKRSSATKRRSAPKRRSTTKKRSNKKRSSATKRRSAPKRKSSATKKR